jgi:hypothetical protein
MGENMKNKILSLALLIAVLLSLGVVKPASARPATVEPEIWYVSSIAGDDSNTCNSTGTPCLTINAAINQSAAGDTIKVAIGTYTASSGTNVVDVNKSITLSGGWDETFTTQDGLSTIDGEGVMRCISIFLYVAGTVSIENFIIENGYSSASGGGISFDGQSLKINNSKISNNFAEGYGAGIIMFRGGAIELNNSTISNNTLGIDSSGGAALKLYIGGTVSINNSTINNNKGNRSAIESSSTASVTININNSTISGNTGGPSVRFYDGTLMVNNSTFTLNQQGGVHTVNGEITMSNTIMAGNGSGADCSVDPLNSGAITSFGYNLIGNKTGCPISATTGDKFGTAVNPIVPNLAPLSDNGGPTFTHALFSNSPALDAGDNTTCLVTDQRGNIRPEGTQCDMGAYEGSIPAIYPIPKSPSGVITAHSPKFSWTKVQGAKKYQIQVFKGSKVMYSKTVLAGTCSTDLCNTIPGTPLPTGEYQWRVRSLIGGTWQTYSPKKYFAISLAAPGYWTWSDDSPRFYVLNSKPIVVQFSILVRNSTCGTQRITHSNEAAISGNHFALTGEFKVNGTFTNVKGATGTLSLNDYYIPGCGYATGGPYQWSAKWESKTQPKINIDMNTLSLDMVSGFETPFEISVVAK